MTIALSHIESECVSDPVSDLFSSTNLKKRDFLRFRVNYCNYKRFQFCQQGFIHIGTLDFYREFKKPQNNGNSGMISGQKRECKRDMTAEREGECGRECDSVTETHGECDRECVSGFYSESV